MHDGTDSSGKTPDTRRNKGPDSAGDFDKKIEELKRLVASIEQDPRYGGYLVTTVWEGDCIIIGDSIIRLKEIKSNKICVAVKAMKHILVRRFPDKDDNASQAET